MEFEGGKRFEVDTLYANITVQLLRKILRNPLREISLHRSKLERKHEGHKQYANTA